MSEEKLTVLIELILLIALFIFYPFILFGCGFIIGLLVKLTFANVFIKAMALLGLTLTPVQIPLFCGALGFIGSFFYSANNKGNNE